MQKAAQKKKRGRKLNYADVLVSFLVVGIIGLIIIPLPAPILDVLIVINLTVAMNILLITLFTKSVLEFTTFPTLLLITTMFKLAEHVINTFDFNKRKRGERD